MASATSTGDVSEPVRGSGSGAAGEPDATPRSRWYRSQGLRLHFLEWGDESAPPLLLLHGMKDHCRSWDWVARRLCRDRRVIVPDLRGHGDSDWVSDGVYSIESYVFDLAQLVTDLSLAPMPIVAHSLGGRIALRYAGIYPKAVARMVVIEGLGPPPSELAATESQPIAERMRDWIEQCRAVTSRGQRRFSSEDDLIARMQAGNPHLPSWKARHLALSGASRNGDGTLRWKFDPRVRVPPPFEMSVPDRQVLWMNIACPLLLLHGSDSFLPDPRIEHRGRQFRDAKIAIVEQAGHWVHHDRLEETVALILAYLAAK